MFKKRSQKNEILDLPNIHDAEIFQNLRELEIINKNLGGLKTSLKGIEYFLTDKNEEYHIIDIGCGGGDFLKSASDSFTNKGFKLKLTGYDLKDSCINYAKDFCKNHNNITLIQNDFNEIFENNQKIDVIHASLFFHHLDEESIVRFLKKAQQSKIKVVINDLERHWLAYHSIALITSTFSKSVLVKNDAKLSVLKGFSNKEWEKILAEIPDIKYQITNLFPFRHLITIEY